MEARIGQQGTLTRVWAKRGTRPRAPHDQRYDWAYLFGAACPQRRVAAGLVMPAANAETMSLHAFNELPLRLEACGEFSDYSIEGIGWSSGWPRLDRRPQARGSMIIRVGSC